jgi:D-alanyl-D-alanine carboxypeptidase
VRYVAGKTAVMTIQQDGKTVEQVILHTLPDRTAMHEMMREKGFRKKNEMQTRREEAIAAPEIKEGKDSIKKLSKKEERAILGQTVPVYATMFQLYAGVAAVLLAVLVGARRRRADR